MVSRVLIGCRRLREHAWLRRGLLILAMFVFGSGVLISASMLVESGQKFEVSAVAPLIGLSIVAIALSALRFAFLSACVRVPVGFGPALGVVVLGTLANILPLPGAVMVRVGFLAEKVGLKMAVQVNLMGIAVWYASAFLLGGVAASLSGGEGWGYIFLAGAVFLFGVGVLIHIKYSFKIIPLVLLVIIQLCLTFVSIMKVKQIAAFIGVDIDLFMTVLFVFSSIVGGSLGLVPGGIGVTESLSAAVGYAAGLSAAAGFLIAGVDRAVTWLLMMLALPFALHYRRVNRGVSR